MNPLRYREQTLGEMLSEMKARLGFAVQGAGSKLIDRLLKSFLQEGQFYVWEQLDAPLAMKRTEIKLSAGSKLYDYHNDVDDQDIHPDMVYEIDVYETDTSVVKLRQGITEKMRCDDTSRDCPRRYDTLNGQLELFPTPDREYRLIIHYREGCTRLEQDSDRTCVPSRLVFLYALASAKAHYGHADAQTAGSIFQTALRTEKSRRHGNRRYFCGHGCHDDRQFVRRTADDKYVL